MTQEYAILIEAAKDLEKAKRELTQEEGSYTSPAFRMVHHAQAHITAEAEALLRSEVN